MNNSVTPSVKDMAKNMNFGFLGKSREQMMAEKRQKEEEELRRRKEQEEEEFERREQEKLRQSTPHKLEENEHIDTATT